MTSSSGAKTAVILKMTVRPSLATWVWPLWIPLLAPVTVMNVAKLVTALGDTSLKRTSTKRVWAETYSAPGSGER